MMQPHEFSQMLNHEACYIKNYWSHFQPVDNLDDFLQCTETSTLQVILDCKSCTQNNFNTTIKEFNSDDSLRELVLNQNNMIFPKKLSHLFQLYLTIYLCQTSSDKISIFYESITSKRFLLGYRGIEFYFQCKKNNEREFFMHVASCFQLVTFYIHEEMLSTALQSYKFFKTGMDGNLDSIEYTTA